MRELERLFDELEGWDDPQRAYQTRCRLAELVLAYRPQQADAWVSAFATGVQVHARRARPHAGRAGAAQPAPASCSTS